MHEPAAQRCFRSRSGGGRGRAFTLIELLVVISVIALLLALSMPCLRRVRKTARTTVCRAHLRQYGLAFAEYTAEHDGMMPNYPEGTPQARETGRLWYQLVLRTPAPTDTDTWLYCPETQIMAGQIPRDSLGKPCLSGYGLNGWVIDAPPMAGEGGGRQREDEWFWRRVDAARSPGRVPVVLDCIGFDQFFPNDGDVPRPQALETADVPGLVGSEMGCFCVARHGPFVNGLFMDWSVRPVGLKELWTLKWHRQYNTSGFWTKAGGGEAENWPQWMRGFKDY